MAAVKTIFVWVLFHAGLLALYALTGITGSIMKALPFDEKNVVLMGLYFGSTAVFLLVWFLYARWVDKLKIEKAQHEQTSGEFDTNIRDNSAGAYLKILFYAPWILFPYALNTNTDYVIKFGGKISAPFQNTEWGAITLYGGVGTIVIMAIGWFLSLRKRSGARDSSKASTGAAAPSFEIFRGASSKLRAKQIDGAQVSTGSKLIKSAGPDASIVVDRMAYFDKKENAITGLSKYEYKVDMKQLTLTSYFVGGTGSGKTYGMNYLINQIHKQKLARREIYNDYKGDFTSYYYREGKDIITSLYDKRAKVFDIFEQGNKSAIVIEKFFEGLVGQLAGQDEKSKFFNSKASEMLFRAFKKVIFNNDFNEMSAATRWANFFLNIETEKENKAENDDAKATMGLALAPLKSLAWRHSRLPDQTFTADDFVYNNDIRLFMVNKKDLEKHQSPYFSGLVSAIFDKILSMPDLEQQEDKENYTLAVLDELYTLDVKGVLDPAVAGRSKGICLMMGVQRQHDNPKIRSVIESSRALSFVYGTEDGGTPKDYATKIGKASFQLQELKVSHGRSEGKGSVNKSVDTQHKEIEILPASAITQIPKHHHICFVPKQGILHYGKTPEYTIDSENVPGFEQIDEMNDLYKFEDELENTLKGMIAIESKEVEAPKTPKELEEKDKKEIYYSIKMVEEEGDEIVANRIAEMVQKFDISTEKVVEIIGEYE